MTPQKKKNRKPDGEPGIELRGESLRNIVGDMPPRLLRWSAAALAAASAVTAAVAAFVAGL